MKFVDKDIDFRGEISCEKLTFHHEKIEVAIIYEEWILLMI